MTENSKTETGSQMLNPRANVKVLIRIAILLFIILGGVWLFFRFTRGEKNAGRVASAILRTPVDLKNSIESLPASSVKWFALSLPYTGNLSLEVTVVKGNDIDIYVMPVDQIENAKNKKPFNHFTEFEGKKSKNYRRNERLKAGNYYLVLFDSTLGLLSARSSENSNQGQA